jgi:hypothetical protein
MRGSSEDFAISAPVDTFTIGEMDQISDLIVIGAKLFSRLEICKLSWSYLTLRRSA